MIKENKGITLIMLSVTIIVLLILATIGINFAIGEEGILKQTIDSKVKAQQAQIEEKNKMGVLEKKVSKIKEKINKANSPKLDDGMIPVYYDEELKVWKKADATNKNNQWYNYSSEEKNGLIL